MKHRHLIPAILICTGAAVAGAETIDRHFEHSFDVEQGAILHLLHGDGDVTITPWDENRIDVDVVYRHELKGWHVGEDKRKFEVRFRESGNHIYVEEQREGTVNLIFGSSIRHEYRYTIKAPRWVQLDLEGEDGNVEIGNWQGDIDVVTDDGDIELLDCASARYDLHLQDGDLTVNRCSGEFDVESSDGDVDFRRVSTNVLQLIGEDGTIDLDLIASGSVDWDIELDDGDLSLEFPQGIDADVDLVTDDGRIRVSGIDDGGRRREYRFSAQVGAGGGSIRARTQDGDLSLRQHDDAP